jgi:hypothetical protein
MKITWKHQHSELASADTEKKIEFFREKVWGWTLYPAHLIMSGGATHDGLKDVEPIPEAGFACLQIVFSYFEMIGHYLEGDNSTNQSEELFTRGFRYVFPDVDTYPYFATKQFLRTLYKGVRCGLYHAAMTGSGIAIAVNDNLPVFGYDNNSNHLFIEPKKLPQTLINNLDSYCAMLREPSQDAARKNFIKRFDKDNPK